MLLRVPQEAHDLATDMGFAYGPVETPLSCCSCDQRISLFEWCYRLDIERGIADFWCPLCVETKLPALALAGKVPR